MIKVTVACSNTSPPEASLQQLRKFKAEIQKTTCRQVNFIRVKTINVFDPGDKMEELSERCRFMMNEVMLTEDMNIRRKLFLCCATVVSIIHLELH